MRVRVEKITPKRAQEWLDKSFELRQRGLSRPRVERLVHAILADQWQLTHQPIALDSDGRVLDGQHRLHAIVQAGHDDPDVEVEALVAWDSAPETFDVIDTGAARTTADTLRIAGYTNANVLAAAVRSTIAYEQLVGTTDPWSRVTSRLTTADVVTFLDTDKNGDRAAAAMSLGARVATAVGRYGLNSSITASALICYRSNAVGSDTLAEFYERLSDGAMLSSSSPILALRRWMIGDHGFGRVQPAYRRPTAIAVTIKAINDYRLGKNRSVVVWRAGIEPTPRLLTSAEVEADRIAREEALAAREAADAAEDAAGDAAGDHAPRGGKRRKVRA